MLKAGDIVSMAVDVPTCSITWKHIPVYLFVVVVFSVCSFILKAIHIVFESECELTTEQGHRESVVLGFLLNAAFDLVHDPLQAILMN